MAIFFEQTVHINNAPPGRQPSGTPMSVIGRTELLRLPRAVARIVHKPFRYNADALHWLLAARTQVWRSLPIRRHFNFDVQDKLYELERLARVVMQEAVLTHPAKAP